MVDKAKPGIPLPGASVRGSRSGAPIMALFDLLGRRWAMGVLWTASDIGPTTFRELQRRCETISSAVLNARLKDLQAAGFLVRTVSGYVVTPLGHRVVRDLLPFHATARIWADTLAAADQSSAETPDRGPRQAGCPEGPT